MTTETTHTTLKNDKKEVTGYEIKIDGALVGVATKTDKGKFNFKAATGAGKDLTDVKTMRDLKVEVTKGTPKEFVEANKPKVEPKAPKAPAKDKAPAAGAPASTGPAAAPKAPGEEDIDLD